MLFSQTIQPKRGIKSKTEQRVMGFATTAGPSGNGSLAPYRWDGQKKKRLGGILNGGEGWVGVPHHSRKAKGDGNFLVLKKKVMINIT